MQVVAATALAAAAARCTEADIEGVDFDKITDAITEFGIPNSQNPVCKKQILWVDDRPENNVYERKAFEAVGLSFYLALSTSDALNIMKNNKFVAIISDMGRREGDQEGYVLLEAIRKQGDRTPFFIYAGSNLIEHKREAVERGAQGSTNNSQELFTLVTKAIINN
jgi:CheY-like chemotaxis protein